MYFGNKTVIFTLKGQLQLLIHYLTDFGSGALYRREKISIKTNAGKIDGRIRLNQERQTSDEDKCRKDKCQIRTNAGKN